MDKFDLLFKIVIGACAIASTYSLFSISSSLQDVVQMLAALVNVLGD